MRINLNPNQLKPVGERPAPDAVLCGIGQYLPSADVYDEMRRIYKNYSPPVYSQSEALFRCSDVFIRAARNMERDIRAQASMGGITLFNNWKFDPALIEISFEVASGNYRLVYKFWARK